MTLTSAEPTDLFEAFVELATRPAPFSRQTTRELWTAPHMAQQMLRYHLDPTTPLASRPPDEIDAAVAWLDAVVGVDARRVCDLGCGPGLYAERLHDRGARVIGVDWSDVALNHARSQARATGREIDYRLLDYLVDPLPSNVDLFTLIYCDYCALPPAARRELLARIRRALGPGGRLALDVQSTAAFVRFTPGIHVERRLLNGFFAPGDYVGARQALRYEAERISLERYLIVEPHAPPWSVFNWLQHFSLESLGRELADAGFEIGIAAGSMGGAELTPGAETLAVVAHVTDSPG